MRIFALGFLIGDLFLQQFRQLPNLAWLSLGLALLLIPWRQAQWRLFAGALLGFCWGLGFAHAALKHRLPQSYEGRELIVQGKVIDLPINDKKICQFYLRPDSVSVLSAANIPLRASLRLRKLKLSWYRPDQQLHSGQTLRLQLKLKRPNGWHNPAGFDYETWLFTHGVDALGYVRKVLPPVSGQNGSWTLGDTINKWRYQQLVNLTSVLEKTESGGLIIALLLGDRQRVSDEQWQLLRATGTNHLLAISGLHIGLLASLSFFLMRRCWPWLAVAQTIPAQRAAVVFAVLVASVYAAMAGFSVPTQRALIMLLVYMLAQWRRRPMLASQGFASALLLVLLLNPTDVLETGFWLSFIAVGCLLFAVSVGTRGLSAWRRWVLPQFVVFAGLGVCLLLAFGQLPVISPFANLLAIPWVSFVTVPLCFIGLILNAVSTTLAQPVFALANHSLLLMQQVLEGLASLATPFQLHGQPGPMIWILAGVGMAWFLVSSAMPLRWAALCCCLPLLTYSAPQLPVGQFRAVVLDSGQGLSVVIETRNHRLVYDTGARFSEKFDTARAAILPWLRQHGAYPIDRLILSHHDSDHMGAAKQLINNYPVKQVLTTWQAHYAVTTRRCQAGMSWQWDHVNFRILHPQPVVPASESDNNRSCVVRISAGQHALLLTGDIEKKSEVDLLRLSGSALHADVLLVPHHGSTSSSSLPFINAVAPRWAVASAGYRNRFGHPRQTIVERYLQRGIAFLSTSHYGALTFLFDVNSSTRLLAAQRIDDMRYWHRDAGSASTNESDSPSEWSS